MKKTFIWFAAIVVPLYIIDQITKWWCVLHFSERKLLGINKNGEEVYTWLNAAGEDRINVIEGLFWLPRVHNQGVAWGIGNGSSWAPVVFLIVPVIALFVLRLLWKKGFFKLKPARYAAPLLLTGVLGNLTDRLTQGFMLEHLKGESFWTRLSEGYVVDFLAVNIPFIGEKGYDFPVFNVADSCISIAATLLFITAIFEEKLAKRQGVELKTAVKDSE